MQVTGNIQMRISIINVPDTMSPIKFKSYIQGEAADIQAKTPKIGYVIIRVYLPERIYFAVTQKKLDALFEKIVNKHSNIHRVVLVRVEQSLDNGQMQEAAKDAQDELKEMGEEADRLLEQHGNSGKSIH